MSKIRKLIDDFTRTPSPKDFAWNDAVKILEHFGYKEFEGAGSRKKFIDSKNRKILLHKRHPDSTLLGYQIELVVETLTLHGHF
ncbi:MULTISPECIES: type II toxin-antitoxin system HicA family toxin [Pseudomonas]|uniref:type II toxin-antitoxin system HicA family toxin n=1 Tax=Pseudomonas TaxID=286 RepID=UPI000EFDF1D8|nr:MULTISPECIES: type II toxin-antitoxin system HicA family toxin [Pseudomonas]MCJ2375150.1 type II toxin-antitoxin system HicA family toxin [Pseudomonas sp. RGM 3321]